MPYADLRRRRCYSDGQQISVAKLQRSDDVDDATTMTAATLTQQRRNVDDAAKAQQ